MQARGYTCVLWNVVPGDFLHPDDWAQRAMEACRAREWSLVVLHDIYTGTMKHLASFIRQLQTEGFELTQDYPPECTPILDGRIVGPMEKYSKSR